jgi:ABC-type Fe3+-siderophore transport system permease subunit
VQDAVERRLHKREWLDVIAFGEKHARSLGLSKSDRISD